MQHPLHAEARSADQPEPKADHAPARQPPVERILALQRSAGNAAVARALLQRDEGGPGQTAGTGTVADTGGGAAPLRSTLNRDDAGEEVELLQLKLNRHLGFMRRRLLLVDGAFGPKTERAVIAFKQQRRMRPYNGTVDTDTWSALDTPPQAVDEAGAQRGVGPEYDRMLEDGLLEVTLAVGYDEHGVLQHEELELMSGLTEVRGFTYDPARGAQLRAAAGRPASQQTGHVYVKENYATSHGQPVHAVVTLILPARGTESGATQRASAMAGMEESDSFMYAGHARYGTGPDFDAQYVVTVHWHRHPRGQPVDRPAVEEFTELDSLEEALGIGDGPAGVTAFEELERTEVVEFRGMAEGNVGMNEEAQSYRGTLGAYLISRSQAGAQAAAPSTAVSERRYRMWMFNGCSTQTYQGAIRQPERHGGVANDRLGTRDLDLITTRVSTQLRWYGETILSTLDGMMAGESARALDRRQDLATPEEYGTHSGQGFADNPRR